ncbi:MAG TPA: hypothetical protein VGV61_08875 [Thermoanaerobaculia bacterium]|jgi:hypothetical protein|nr:hypothetical protein [Thermoanaerobaculia bacterium]
MTFGQTFLVHPDLFPARVAGEPWGDVAASIAFAGGRYLVRGLSAPQLAVVRQRLGPMLDPPEAAGDGAVQLDVLRADAADFLHERPRHWEYTFDLDAQPAAVRVAGLRFVGRLDWRPRPAAAEAALRGALWTSVGAGDELPMVFENFLRLLAAYDLVARGGLLLHSAGIAIDGGALLFFGPSGAGKSTLAALAAGEGRRVLSDDLNALVVAAGAAPMVEKVPFAGDLGGGPETLPALPLRGLCRLRQGESVAARALTPAAALAALFAAAPFVNADPFRGPALESSLLAIAGAVPVVELTFARDSSFAAIVDAVSR